jgi:hypothetical protein
LNYNESKSNIVNRRKNTMLAFIVLTIVCGFTYLLLKTGSGKNTRYWKPNIGVTMCVNTINLTSDNLSIYIGDLKTINEEKVKRMEEIS